jgi:hypothetical protein
MSAGPQFRHQNSERIGESGGRRCHRPAIPTGPAARDGGAGHHRGGQTATYAGQQGADSHREAY